MRRGPKPSSVVIKAKFGNPGRRKIPENEPNPESSIPDPPSFLDGYAVEEWRRVAPELARVGLLSEIDRALLAGYCTSYSQWRSAREEMNKRTEKGGMLASLVDVTKAGNVIQNCLVGISNKAQNDMGRFADLLGMGAAARARMGLDRQKGAGKFDGLIGSQGGQK